MPQKYIDSEEFHELVETLVLAVAGGQYPSFDFVRAAVEAAESMSAAAANGRAADDALQS